MAKRKRRAVTKADNNAVTTDTDSDQSKPQALTRRPRKASAFQIFAGTNSAEQNDETPNKTESDEIQSPKHGEHTKKVEKRKNRKSGSPAETNVSPGKNKKMKLSPKRENYTSDVDSTVSIEKDIKCPQSSFLVISDQSAASQFNDGDSPEDVCSRRDKVTASERQFDQNSHSSDIRMTPVCGLENCNAFLLESSEQVLVIMKHPTELYLKGRIKLRSLYGTVSVLGHFISPNGRFYDLYSPESNSSLGISTVQVESKKLDTWRGSIEEYIKDEPLEYRKQILESGSKNSIVLLLKELPDKSCDFLTLAPPFQHLFSTRNRGVSWQTLNDLLIPFGACLMDESSSSGIHISNGFHQTAEMFVKSVTEKVACPVLVVCGGKNSGKSTLIRFLLNSALNFSEAVGYLDCDPGQSEFTPAGCVSYTTVKQALLGPPFSHLRTCDRSCFTGFLSPSADPTHYVKCLEFVYQKYQEMSPQVPLIVNTMGWNKGLGLLLLSDILRMVEPTFVIQLDSRSQHKNFPPLTAQFVQQTQGWVNKKQLLEYDHDLHIIDSVSDLAQEKKDKFGAVDHRNLAIMSYFGETLPSGVTSLNAVTPRIVPWNSIAVHVCHVSIHNNQIMYALNGGIVALCSVPESMIMKNQDRSLPGFLKQTPVCKVTGFGIIRAIDPVAKVFYLLTPVSSEQLHTVNCFLKGGLEIPQALIMKQKIKENAPLPYVDLTTSAMGIGGIKERQYLQRKRYSGPTLLE